MAVPGTVGFPGSADAVAGSADPVPGSAAVPGAGHGAGSPVVARPGGAYADRRIALVDLLDRLLAGGVVLDGELSLCIADVELVRISVRALITAVEKVATREDLPVRDTVTAGERGMAREHAAAAGGVTAGESGRERGER